MIDESPDYSDLGVGFLVWAEDWGYSGWFYLDVESNDLVDLAIAGGELV